MSQWLHDSVSRKGVTHGRLSELSGVARPTISRILNAHTEAEDATLERLATALSVDLPEAIPESRDAAHVGAGEPGPGRRHGDAMVMEAQQLPYAGGQLPDDEILQLLLYDRPGFVRFLQRTWADPRVPVAAKLQFLEFVEEIARERSVTVPKEYLEHLRGLIRERGL